MSLHINKNRDNNSELEHDDPDSLVSEWFDNFENKSNKTYNIISQNARSWGKTETASNLIWQCFN